MSSVRDQIDFLKKVLDLGLYDEGIPKVESVEPAELKKSVDKIIISKDEGIGDWDL